MIIRALERGDLEQVLSVQRDAYPIELLEPLEAFEGKLSIFPQGALGCFDNEVLSAYVFSIPWRIGETVPLGDKGATLPARPNCLYIHDMAVGRCYLGIGLAKRLTAEVSKLAKILGLPACGLVSVQCSEQFWERLGFVKQYDLEYGPGITASYMLKELQ